MKVRIPQSGGPANMQSMLRQAQKMQEDMAAKQAELEAREYEAAVGGGVLTVKMNGKKELLSVKISDDKDILITLTDVVSYINECMQSKKDVKQ